MFSTKAVSKESRTVAIVRKTESSKVKLTVWFTELSRDMDAEDTFKEDTKSLFNFKNAVYSLKDPTKYSIELTPHSRVTPKFPRFVNYYLAQSNSGKSYNIAQLCQKYLEVFPDNNIIYISANPLENDTNYDPIRKKILEVDVMKMENSMEFTEFKDCLMVFDDCDAAFSTSLEDLDERLTPEMMKSLSTTDRDKARKMLQKRTEQIPSLINDSIKSMMFLGRKNNISLCIVGHKYNDGASQMRILSESSGVVLFPYSTKKPLLKTFLEKKLSFEKDEAERITKMKWYQYDFLFVNSTGSPFIITPETIEQFF